MYYTLKSGLIECHIKIDSVVGLKVTKPYAGGSPRDPLKVIIQFSGEHLELELVLSEVEDLKRALSLP